MQRLPDSLFALLLSAGNLGQLRRSITLMRGVVWALVFFFLPPLRTDSEFRLLLVDDLLDDRDRDDADEDERDRATTRCSTVVV